jgi:hypothetical protein
METINFFGYLLQIDIKSIRGINGKVLIIRVMYGNKIQNEDKQNKEIQHNTKQKTKKISNTDPTKKRG